MEMRHGQLAVAFLSLFVVVPSVWAVPDTTMSITPSATSATTITAADENSRNNAISTAYSNHSHTDLTKTTQNTFTIGDGTTGTKNLCEDATTDRCLRWDDTATLWLLQQFGSTYNEILVASGAGGLTGNNVLIGNGTGAVIGIANGTSGQFLKSNGSASAPTWTASTVVKVGSVTRDTTLGSSTQTVSGLGLTPTAVILFANQSGSTEGSWGFSDGTANRCQLDNTANTVDTYDTNTSNAVCDLEGVATSYNGVVNNFVSGAFDIVWTRTAAPSGTLTISYIAVGY